MSIYVIAHPQTGRLFLFHLLFGVAYSTLLWLVPSFSTFCKRRCHRMFWSCKFTINQLHVNFVTTWGSSDVIQSRASCITKWDKCFILQSRPIGITKQSRCYNVEQFLCRSWGRYYRVGQLLLQIGVAITMWGNCYKVAQYRRQMRETRESKRFLQLTPWFNPDLPGDRQFAPRNSSEVEFLLESKERRNHTPTTGVSAWLVSSRSNYLKMFLELKTLF